MRAVFLRLISGNRLSAIIRAIALYNSWFGWDAFEIGQIRLILRCNLSGGIVSKSLNSILHFKENLKKEIQFLMSKSSLSLYIYICTLFYLCVYFCFSFHICCAPARIVWHNWY